MFLFSSWQIANQATSGLADILASKRRRSCHRWSYGPGDTPLESRRGEKPRPNDREMPSERPHKHVSFSSTLRVFVACELPSVLHELQAWAPTFGDICSSMSLTDGSIVDALVFRCASSSSSPTTVSVVPHRLIVVTPLFVRRTLS